MDTSRALEIEQPEMQEMQEQEAITVTPEMLLAQIVAHIGPEFVIIPLDGWSAIVKTIKDYQKDKDDNLLEILESLGVPVVPVSLAGKKEEESSIIMPNGVPQGESRIITP